MNAMALPAHLETTALRVPSRSGEPLALAVKQAAALDPARPPVLLLHGATLGGKLFDLPRSGYSLMAHLATAGRAVYALDLRGYGASPGGQAFERPATENPPCTRSLDSLEDVGAAVDMILARHGASALDLIGFSWGTITAAAYAGRLAERVARLVLYAPLYAEINERWLDRIADPNDRSCLNPALGAYRVITLAELTSRWNSDLPPSDPARYRDDGLPELVFDTIGKLDPTMAAREPPSFRCPNGALADLVDVFNARALYDPAKLTMPTLLIRGSEDTTSTDSDARRLLGAIASDRKDYRVVAGGSHFLCVEKNHGALYAHLDDFLRPLPMAN